MLKSLSQHAFFQSAETLYRRGFYAFDSVLLGLVFFLSGNMDFLRKAQKKVVLLGRTTLIFNRLRKILNIIKKESTNPSVLFR